MFSHLVFELSRFSLVDPLTLFRQKDMCISLHAYATVTRTQADVTLDQVRFSATYFSVGSYDVTPQNLKVSVVTVGDGFLSPPLHFICVADDRLQAPKRSILAPSKISKCCWYGDIFAFIIVCSSDSRKQGSKAVQFCPQVLSLVEGEGGWGGGGGLVGCCGFFCFFFFGFLFVCWFFVFFGGGGGFS